MLLFALVAVAFFLFLELCEFVRAHLLLFCEFPLHLQLLDLSAFVLDLLAEATLCLLILTDTFQLFLLAHLVALLTSHLLLDFEHLLRARVLTGWVFQSDASEGGRLAVGALVVAAQQC